MSERTDAPRRSDAEEQAAEIAKVVKVSSLVESVWYYRQSQRMLVVLPHRVVGFEGRMINVSTANEILLCVLRGITSGRPLVTVRLSAETPSQKAQESGDAVLLQPLPAPQP